MNVASETDDFSGVRETHARGWADVGASLLVVGFALVVGALGLLAWLITELMD